ncbi:hypothetical protein TNCV_3622091 [Trichonephila clavipes]|nr:hypothetical protein TNCV_3622091 [Trichonephila clavipes]
MDKGIWWLIVSFRTGVKWCRVSIGLKHKEGRNYHEVDGYLFHRDKILGESIGQLVIRSAEEREVLRTSAYFRGSVVTWVPRRSPERIASSYLWEGLRSDVKKIWWESCRMRLSAHRSVGTKDRSHTTPVGKARIATSGGEYGSDRLQF